ncbi:hypothetical protein PHYSODRAFT_328659 [Phytophthora sojae]|uniref:Uncharacterized protein n=1 Tax=Phytophthora sojae (strain P6497) TaxID=1094619 RepID=G4ZA07_PHYSP|nr:hypothetical protein PHYSODRAFT_328659 [Phytophthora sojae]EGZ20556.1 hypothetical protein PHYSODRAFT_328659 [Phytophthora sojae]|eukprot:XP_009523273.1 hypothetical protein PHYSODRAFT_328659 [Phytophthora sojae]
MRTSAEQDSFSETGSVFDRRAASSSWAVCILGGLRGTNWRRSEEKLSEVSHTVHNDLPTEGECEQAPNKIRSPSQAAYSIDELRAHLGRSASWAVCILGGLRGTNWRRSEEKLSEVSHTVHNDLPTEGECEQAPNKIRSPRQAAYSIDELRAHLGRSEEKLSEVSHTVHNDLPTEGECEEAPNKIRSPSQAAYSIDELRAHLGRSASWAVCILGGLRGTNWRRSEEKLSEVSHTVHNDLPTEGECEQAPNKIRSPSQAAYSIDELRAHLGRSASWAVCAGRIGEGARRNRPK